MSVDIQAQNLPEASPIGPVNNCDCVKGVRVRKAVKSFGVGKRRNIILDELNMTVKKGSM